MGVDIDHKGIARTAAALGGEGTVILRLRTEDTLDEATINASVHPQDEPPNGGWFAGPGGWLLLLEGLPGEVNTYLETLAQRLSHSGVSGVLTGAGTVGIPTWAQRLDEGLNLYALVGYRPRPGAGPYDGWTPERRVLDAAVESAMEWVTEGDAKVMASVASRANFWVDAPTAARLMTTDVLRSGIAGAAGYNQNHRVVHEAHLTPPACAALTMSTDQSTWQQVVDEARSALLVQRLDDVSIAMLTDKMWLHLMLGFAPGESPVDGRAYSWHPEIWHAFTLDPCGIQILTDEHLAKAHDLSAWSLTRLDETHHLVQAADLEPWYGNIVTGQPVPADVLDRARRDFGEMILTPQRAERLGYATKPPRRKN